MIFSGFVNGEGPGVLGPGLTIKSDVKSSSPAGTYTLTPAAAVDPNYDITYDSGTLTVGQASLLITASSPTVTYTGQAPAITPGYSGLQNGDSAPATPPACATTPPLATGVGTYTTSCSGAAEPNYSISYATGTLTINPAHLAITANDKSMTYGGTVPAFDATFNGFVNGEGPGVLSGLTCGALDGHGNPVSSTTPAGSYTINCSGATDPNYSISYTAGTLTIDRAPLTITANDKTTIYGQPMPAFDASFSGFVNGEGPGVLSGLTCGALDAHGNPVTPTTAAVVHHQLLGRHRPQLRHQLPPRYPHRAAVRHRDWQRTQHEQHQLPPGALGARDRRRGHAERERHEHKRTLSQEARGAQCRDHLGAGGRAEQRRHDQRHAEDPPATCPGSAGHAAGTQRASRDVSRHGVPRWHHPQRGSHV